THHDAAARLRAHAGTAGADTATVAVSDLRLLIERCEALERDHDHLQRRADKALAMLDAATVFLKAYGEKYRNFASGGIRPTAILQNEVKVMWAIFKEFRDPMQSEGQENPGRDLWSRDRAGG
ncbi:MAG: hypothetical protein ACK4N1_14010, partial [Pseudorhizobium sp.]